MTQSSEPPLWQNSVLDTHCLPWLSPYSPPNSSGLNIYHDLCILSTKSNEMKGSIQIAGQVNNKVNNVVCARRPEHVALRRDNRSPHCHTKDNLKQRLWELSYTGVLEYPISSNRLAWASLIQRSQVVSYLASELFRIIAELGRRYRPQQSCRATTVTISFKEQYAIIQGEHKKTPWFQIVIKLKLAGIFL